MLFRGMLDASLRPPAAASAPAPIAEPGDGPTVAVIGAGFSGALMAIRLASRPGGPRVRLFERGAAAGPGAAFGTDHPQHLLNVRARAMSALADAPDHFVKWLAARGRSEQADDFAPRSLYGRYLQDLLAAAPPEALVIDPAEVVAVHRDGGAWRLATRDGRNQAFEAVVLATGHAPPAAPPGLDPALTGNRRYVDDPWSPDADLSRLGRRVLLLGSGLTMIDVALALKGGGRVLTAISRRGLTPRAHAPVPAPPCAAPQTSSPLALLREIRRAGRTQDWRAVVDALRPRTQAIWAGWTPAEQGRFLRHARPWWDVHRHRSAPVAARRIDALLTNGALRLRAARIRALRLTETGVELLAVDRSGRDVASATFDAVVNCLGPQTDVRQSQDPLMRHLLASGLVRPDRWALGLDLDGASRLLDCAGRPTPGLYAVGPLARGHLWEITAVPDIRVQVEAVTASLLASAELRRPR